MNKLKPCPFCGSNELSIDDPFAVDCRTSSVTIRCGDCDIDFTPSYGSLHPDAATENAVHSWERRHTLSPWINVNDRKPEYDKVVMVAFDNHQGKNYTTAVLHKQKRCADPRSTEYDEVWYVHVSGGHRLNTVTHWQEIDRSLEGK